jgi:hypothetical protein
MPSVIDAMKQILALCVGGRTACCLLLSTVLNGKLKEQPQRKPRLYPPTVQIVDTASFHLRKVLLNVELFLDFLTLNIKIL